jgi:hypothetical protein
VTTEKAKVAIETLTGKRKSIQSHEGIPFSLDVRRLLDAATNVIIAICICSHLKNWCVPDFAAL